MVPQLDLLELIFRVSAAAGAGVAIGFEREVGDHVAGIRTHTLVAVGAAMFAIGGAYGFADVPRVGNADPARVAAQVASGIGFVGAGAIVKDGAVVRGLTTAATLWLSAALGMAGGAGAYGPLAVGLAVVMIVLTVLRSIKPAALRMTRKPSTLNIVGRLDLSTLASILRGVEASGAKVERLSIRDADVTEPADMRSVVLDLRQADPHRLSLALGPLTGRDQAFQMIFQPAQGLRLRRFGAMLRRLLRRPEPGRRLL